MQLRGRYRFGETLKDIDLQLSARGHQPAYRELEAWYSAEEQAALREQNGMLPKKRALAEWQCVGDVVAAYWADPSNLRRGFVPPDPDYTDSTHLNLEDGTKSLEPRPPRAKRRLSTADGASPRERLGTAASSPELDDGAFENGRRNSAAPPPDYAPPFPTSGYWLPPLSQPLTSATHQVQDGQLKHQHVISGDRQERKDPHLPATWSLSPT